MGSWGELKSATKMNIELSSPRQDLKVVGIPSCSLYSMSRISCICISTETLQYMGSDNTFLILRKENSCKFRKSNFFALGSESDNLPIVHALAACLLENSNITDN